MKKGKNILIIVTFLFYILFILIGTIIVKDRDYSDNENRVLKQYPDASAENIVSGQYMKDFEDYMADQIILKDDYVKLHNDMVRMSGQKFEHGIFFGKDGYIIQDYVYDEEVLGQNIKFINQFKEEYKNVDITMLVIPTAAYILKDKLPADCPVDDQGQALKFVHDNLDKDIRIADATEELQKAKDEYIFYKTDHHWTEYGAYLGYKCLAEKLGLKVHDRSEYSYKNAGKEFFGTLYSKAPNHFAEGDTVTIFMHDGGEYNVEYLDEGWSENSLFHVSNLSIKDKYTVYLDGNHALVRITSNAPDKEPIIVVKDSYAHSLLPYLADNYGDIYVVDLRYYHDSVSMLMEEKDIKKVILINNIDFLTTEKYYKMFY